MESSYNLEHPIFYFENKSGYRVYYIVVDKTEKTYIFNRIKVEKIRIVDNENYRIIYCRANYRLLKKPLVPNCAFFSSTFRVRRSTCLHKYKLVKSMFDLFYDYTVKTN